MFCWVRLYFVVLTFRRPPISTRTDILLPNTTLCRSHDRDGNSPRRRASIGRGDGGEVGGGGQGELGGQSALALLSCAPPCKGGVGGGSAAAREKATIRH